MGRTPQGHVPTNNGNLEVAHKKFIKLHMDKSTIPTLFKTEPDFQPPRPIKPGRPPSSRYYEYHEDTCHNTEQCY